MVAQPDQVAIGRSVATHAVAVERVLNHILHQEAAQPRVQIINVRLPGCDRSPGGQREQAAAGTGDPPIDQHDRLMRAKRTAAFDQHARRAALHLRQPDASRLRRAIIDPQLGRAAVARHRQRNGDRRQRLGLAGCRKRRTLGGRGVGQQIGWRSLLPAIGQGYAVYAGRFARASLQQRAGKQLSHAAIQPDRRAERRAQITRAVILLPEAQELALQPVAGCRGAGRLTKDMRGCEASQRTHK